MVKTLVGYWATTLLRFSDSILFTKRRIFLPFVFGLTLFSLASHIHAAKPTDFGLKEGDLISAIFSSDPDVYIINDQGYKRLFLNPEIFKFYKHLGGFANVKLVTSEVRDSFPTSGLFRNCEDKNPKVYGIEVSGEDKGALHWINEPGDQVIKDDPNFFKKVFCINKKEFDWYPKKQELKSVKELPVYAREAIPVSSAVPAIPAVSVKTVSSSQPLIPTTTTRPASGSLAFTPVPSAILAQPTSSAQPSSSTPAHIASVSFSTPIPTPTPTLTPTPTPTPTPTTISSTSICVGGDGRVSGLPICLMPENLTGTAWNEVDNATGKVLNVAVCSVAVCGRGGQWRTWPSNKLLNDRYYLHGYPENSTYIQTPFDTASWGQYFTNGVWQLQNGGITQPGSGPTPTPTPTPTPSSTLTPTPTPTPDTIPPTTPTNLSAIAVSSSQINLSWSASTDNVGVDGYKIYRNGVYWYQVTKLNYVSSLTAYSDTGLSSNTSYSYYIKAFDAAGNVSSASATVSATTPSGTTSCSGLNLTFQGGKTSYIIGETATYTYSCAPGGSASYVEIQVVKPDGTATTYNFASGSISTNTLGFGTSNLVAGNYTLRACFATGCSSVTASLPFTITAPTPMPTPTPTPTPSLTPTPAASITVSAPTTQSNFSRNLALGSTGPDVKQLQALLVNEVDYSADLITGYFGQITWEAVKRLQEKYGVRPISGYFGEITRKALKALITN